MQSTTPEPCDGGEYCTQSPKRIRGMCSKHYTRWIRKHGAAPKKVPEGVVPCDFGPECHPVVNGHGMCSKHYARWFKHGDPTKVMFERSAQGEECSAGGCSRRPWAKGYCATHYQRMRAGNDMSEPIREHDYDAACSVTGCDLAHVGAGFCAAHRARFIRSGDPGPAAIKPRIAQTWCNASGCDAQFFAKGFCSTHYHRYVTGPVRRAKTRCKIDAHVVHARMAYWGFKCWICGGPFEHVDHVKPLGAGGLHIPANLRPACARCNLRKNRAWPFDVDEFKSKCSIEN